MSSSQTFPNASGYNLAFTSIAVTETDSGSVTPFVGQTTSVDVLGAGGGEIDWAGFHTGAIAPGGSETLDFTYNVTSTNAADAITNLGLSMTPDSAVEAGESLTAIETVYNPTTGAELGQISVNLANPTAPPYTAGDIPLSVGETSLNVNVEVIASVASTAASSAQATFSQIDQSFGQTALTSLGAIGDNVFLSPTDSGVQSGVNAGPGVAGVTVELENTSGTVLETTTTNSQGLYDFTNLVAGTYEVQFVAPTGYDFTPQTSIANDLGSAPSPTTGITQPITLAAGETLTNIDAGLYQPASIGDNVFLSPTDSGVQSGVNAGPGVAGVTVELENTSGTVLETTTTNSNGLYDFTNVTPGTYQVQFVAPTGYQFTPQTSIANDLGSAPNQSTGITAPITVTSGETLTNIDAGLYQPPVTPTGPSISVIKVPNSVVVSGSGEVTYTIDVTNTGNTDLYNLQVTDNIGTATSPDNVTPTPVLSDGYNVGDTNHSGVFTPGETWVYTVTTDYPQQSSMSSRPPSSPSGSPPPSSGMSPPPSSPPPSSCGPSSPPPPSSCGPSSPPPSSPSGSPPPSSGMSPPPSSGMYPPPSSPPPSSCGPSSPPPTSPSGSPPPSSGMSPPPSSPPPSSCGPSSPPPPSSCGPSSPPPTSPSGSPPPSSGMSPPPSSPPPSSCGPTSPPPPPPSSCGPSSPPPPPTQNTGYADTVTATASTCAPSSTSTGGCDNQQGSSGSSGQSGYGNQGGQGANCDNNQQSGYGNQGGSGDNNQQSGYGNQGGQGANCDTNQQSGYGNQGGQGDNNQQSGYGSQSGSGSSDNSGQNSGWGWGLSSGSSWGSSSSSGQSGYGSQSGSGDNNRQSGYGSQSGQGDNNQQSGYGSQSGSGDNNGQSSGSSTCVTVTATDTKEIQLLSANSDITVGGTAPTGNLESLYGTAQTLEFTYNPGDTVSLASGSTALASVSGANSNSMAFMEISNNANPFASGSQIYFKGSVTTGENIYADAALNPLTNTANTGASSHFSTTPGAETYAFIFGSQADFNAGDAPIQTMAYDTSGAHSMNLGDTIGSLKLAGYIGDQGGHLVA